MLKVERLLSVVFTVVMLAGFSMVKPTVTYAAAKGSTNFLKVNGQVLKNNSGKGSVVQLKGTNLGGLMLQEDWMSPLGAIDEYTARTTLINRFGVAATDSLVSSYEDIWTTTADFNNIKSYGMNMVRLPIYWENVMDRNGNMKSDAWTKIDWIVNQCASRDIYVMLDLHGLPGGNNGWQSGGRIANELWTNSTYQTWTVNLWKAMAAHYKGNATVCGYDLMNEPVSNSATITNSVFYNTLYQAVRAVDPDHTIFIEAFYDFDDVVSPSTYGWTNVVYETHHYDMGNSGDGEKQLAFAYSQLEILSKYKSLWNVPVYAGEYSFYDFNNVWDTWLSGLNTMGISWTNWSYKVDGNMGNWGFFTNNTNPSPDLNNDSQATILSKWSKFTTINFVPNTTFQNLIKKYTGSTMPNPSGSVYLRSVANSKIISNDTTGTTPLAATKTAVDGASEGYYNVINNKDGTISLQSMANNLYVSVDLKNSAKLIAKSSSIHTTEKFNKIVQDNGSVALKAVASHKYVSCEINNGAILAATKKSIGGSGETFYITPHYSVFTPTFSPMAGIIKSATDVTISCATKGATIKYTQDGSDPKTSSTAKTGTSPINITVNPNTTLNAYAFKSDMPDSYIATAKYILPILAKWYQNFETGIGFTAGTTNSTVSSSVESATTSGTKSVKLVVDGGGDFPGIENRCVNVTPQNGTSIDTTGFNYLVFDLKDTQGNNTQTITMVDTNNKIWSGWTSVNSVKDQWTQINLPLSSVTGINKAEIKEIRVGQWNEGIYYIDDIYFAQTLTDPNPSSTDVIK